jgi:uncharacterized protein with HEPN domain
MLSAIAEIDEFTRGLDFAEFRQDPKTTRAVAYNFVVIGEAARHVPVDIQTRHDRIPWSVIRGMRNIVAHEYHRVDPDELWKTLTQDLPPLVVLLRDLLEREP